MGCQQQLGEGDGLEEPLGRKARPGLGGGSGGGKGRGRKEPQEDDYRMPASSEVGAGNQLKGSGEPQQDSEQRSVN